ncbi:unnamed protein product [Cuscuta epithymum]|uniref:Uncharacterized protein n=1 Tax=Cuscuta epithymum TaxID=186058 RepID=A0AAV0G7S8_9ASTE|nr:unnamed protein product [Cuscuta epithymum]
MQHQRALAGEIQRDSRNGDFGGRRQVVAGVKDGEFRGGRQVLGVLLERVAEGLVRHGLKPGDGGARVDDDAAVPAAVDLENRRRNGELVAADADPGEPDVEEGVNFRIPEHRRRDRVTGTGRIELESRGGAGIAVDEAVGERGRFNLRG